MRDYHPDFEVIEGNPTITVSKRGSPTHRDAVFHVVDSIISDLELMVGFRRLAIDVDVFIDPPFDF